MVIIPSAVSLTPAGTWRGFRTLMPIAIFSLPFGIAFGAAAVGGGLSPTQAIAMSCLVFSGAAQFAALDSLRAIIPWEQLALVTLAVSARLVVMGAALGPWLNGTGRLKRLTVSAWLSDPNFAHSQSAMRNGERDIGHLLGGGLALWSNWVVGTAIGALAGDFIGDVSRFGFDLILPTYFATIVAGELRSTVALLPIAVASVVALVASLYLPGGWAVIAAGLAGAAASMLRR